MINEETLTLYYYNDELSDRRRRQVEAALTDDAALARQYAELCQNLNEWRNIEDEKAPSHLVQQLHNTIDRAARLESGKMERHGRSFHVTSFAWGAAATAALVLTFVAGMYFSDESAVHTLSDQLVADLPQERAMAIPTAFTRGLQVHLRQSQGDIASLSPEENGDRMFLLMQIVEQNRMFERAATQNNAPQVARLLRAFEPILLKLASDDITPEDATALRAQLAFELNVMLTKLARGTSEEAQTI